jgi:hypothetical protein
LNPLYAIPSAALSAVTVTQIVGESAIRHYKEAVEAARETAIEPGSF